MPYAEPPPQPHTGRDCQVCPLCILIGAVADSRPEVREHLQAAGREIAAALRAALDGVDEQGARGSRSSLRRIDLEEDSP